MKIREISSQDFEKVSICEPNANILQSNLNAEYMKKEGYEPLFIENLDNNDIAQGYALLLLKKDSFFSFKPSAYCFDGYLTNFYDSHLLKQFNSDLIKFLNNKKVKKLVVEPPVELNEGIYSNNLIIKAFNESGFNKTNNKYHYHLKTRNRPRIEGLDNVVYRVNKVSKDDDLLLNILDKDNYDLYSSFENNSELYVFELDVYSSKTKLNSQLNKIEKFIEENKDVLEHNEEIKEANRQLESINKTLAYLEKYNNDKVITNIIGLSKYCNEFKVLFNINKDEDNYFNAYDILINEICKQARSNKIEYLKADKPIDGFEEVEYLGEFTFTF